MRTQHLSQGHPLFFLFVFFLFSACGAPEKTGYHISPSAGFDSKAEDIPLFKRCNESSTYGCANIQTTGNMARSDFLFKDLYITCATTEAGFQVSMTNSISETVESTFRLTISLYGLSAPVLMYTCNGPVDNGAGGVAAGSCDVSARVHSTVVASTPTNACTLRFEADANPVSGSVECPFLDSGQNYLSIAMGSQFTCQP